MTFMVDRVPMYAGPGVELRIVIPQNGMHSAACATSVEFHTINDGEMIPAAMKLNPDEAQQLCDALWEAGIRPTNGEGSTGQLAATREHLADMKTIAFHALKVVGVAEGGAT
jgi:hypothetical protein